MLDSKIDICPPGGYEGRKENMVKKNIRKYKIMEKHMELVKSGNYMFSRNLLKLLQNGFIRLGLGDADFETECFLESIGCPVNYGRNGYSATFRI